MSRIYELAAPVLNIGVAVALLAVLILLVMGRFSRFWMVFLYALWESAATLGLTIADVIYHGTSSGATPAQLMYARVYWTNDVLVDLFRFVLVIVLIHMVSEGTRRIPGRLLAAVVVAMLVLPFVLFPLHSRLTLDIGPLRIPFPTTKWFRSTSELLNFGAAIMNLMLWAMLIASKKRDPQVLLVSLGLGIVVTGTALAYGVRYLLGSREVGAAGYLFMNLTQLTGWLIWCRAFWPAARSSKIVPASVPSQ